jgi:flagellar hook assembly protein FlgD
MSFHSEFLRKFSLLRVFSLLIVLCDAKILCAITAVITSPTQNQVLSNVYSSGATIFAVNGSILGPNLRNWILDYGSGGNPSSWTVISSGINEINNGLIGSWQTKPGGIFLANGTYTLRLTAWDTGGISIENRKNVNLKHFKVGQSLLEFNGAAGSNVTYTSTVPFTLTETLEIRNASGQLVRSLVSAQQRTAGDYNDNWNGRNGSGRILPDGAYFYKAIVTDGTYTMTWDLTNEYLNGVCYGNLIWWTSFDPYDNLTLAVPYNYTRTGKISVKFYSCNQNQPNTCLEDTCPETYTFISNKYEETGAHTVRWASVDDSGARKFLPWGKVFNKQDTFSKNAVVLYGTKPTISNLRVNPPVFNPARGTQQISFNLGLYSYQSQTGNITVTILNQETSPPSVLRTIPLNSAAGPISIVWNGRNNTGQHWLAPSNYTVRVKVTDSVIGNVVEETILTTIQF